MTDRRVRHSATGAEGEVRGGTCYRTAEAPDFAGDLAGVWLDVQFDDGLRCLVPATVLEEVRPPSPSCLTFGQLREAVNRATWRGLDPETRVVVYRDGGYYLLDPDVGDPTDHDNHGALVWLTLSLTEPEAAADTRFDPGHHA